MRLFIASPVKLYDYTKIERIFSKTVEGRWTKEKNLHMTWIFIGETQNPQKYIDMLSLVKNMDIKLQIKGIGHFSNRILYAKVTQDSIIDSKIDEFKEAGFEIKNFKAHITLCRIKKISDWKRLKKLEENLKNFEIGEVLNEINLYKSRLTPKGAIYEKITSIN